MYVSGMIADVQIPSIKNWSLGYEITLCGCIQNLLDIHCDGVLYRRVRRVGDQEQLQIAVIRSRGNAGT